MPSDTGIRKSGGHRIMQIKCRCGIIFTRQARRLKKTNSCRKCLKRNIPRINSWSTAKLKQAITNDNNTDQYIDIIDDIKELLWEREDRKMNEMLEFKNCFCIEG